MDSLSITYNTIVNSFSLAFDGSFMRGRGNLWMMAVDTIQSSDLLIFCLVILILSLRFIMIRFA